MPVKYRSGCSQSSIRWNTGSPMKELEKVPKELKWSADLSEKQYELSNMSRACVSSCICSRGWPSWLPVGEEVLGLSNILGPSIGECKGQEVGVGWWWSRGRGKGTEYFQRRN